MTQATYNQIAQRAYEIYKTRKESEGNSLEDWLTAERQTLDDPSGVKRAPSINLDKRNSVQQTKSRKTGEVQKNGVSPVRPKGKTSRTKLAPKPDIK